MTDNMKIWDAVSKTNPKHTKQVNQRGGFTAVNANSQIMAATEYFGPIGTGWGYVSGDPLFTPQDLVIVPVTLWHGNRENTFGPEYGSAALVSNGRTDSDAPKKATTDALTKLLSRLGFNADVFLGLYDDNKYVAEMEREFAPKVETISDDQRGFLETLCDNTGVNPAEFLSVGGIKDFREVPITKFEDAKAWIAEQAKEKENT